MGWTTVIVAYSQARGKNKLFDAHSHSTLLTLGACLENIDSSLASLGLSGQWQIDVSAAPENPYAQLTFASAGDFPSPSSSALPLFNRHTNRFPYKPTRIPSEALDAISGLTQSDARVIILSHTHTGKDELVTYARLAAEARFCTQELHDWLMGSLRFTPDGINGGEGLDIHTLDLPPFGSLFMRFIANWSRMTMLNKLDTYKAMAFIDTRLLVAAPALVCIVGPMGPNDIIAAGRLLANLWSKLNEKGIAVHPYYVITDQLQRLQADAVPSGMVDRIRRIREELPLPLKLHSDETLHMVLRIGLPKTDTPRTRRLPLSTVYKDLTKV